MNATMLKTVRSYLRGQTSFAILVKRLKKLNASPRALQDFAELLAALAHRLETKTQRRWN